jgi:hypothetical protein
MGPVGTDLAYFLPGGRTVPEEVAAAARKYHLILLIDAGAHPSDRFL